MNQYFRIMEELLGHICIGILVGLVVIYFMAASDRREQHQRNRRSQTKTVLEQQKKQYQRDEILIELGQKQPESTTVKTEAVFIVYQFAASRSSFTLKDVASATRNLQNHYQKAIKNKAVYKMNFPDKELLSFEPLEILYLLTIINEGLHNAIIHSEANYIFSIASVEEGRLNIITHDNGKGYSRKLIADGNGIKTIENAVQKLHADLKFTSTAGNGTVVNVEIEID
jgi:type II secretory pathway pseudopilin PulG